MGSARTLRNDREKMGEHPMYRPSRAPGQLQPQPHQAAGGARLRRSDDPLAELARLIGQEDPFKEFDAAHQSRARVNGNGNGRSNGNGAAYHAPAVAPERRADRYTNGNGSGYSGGTSEAPHRNGRDDLTPPRQPVSRQAQPAPARPAAHTEEQYPAPRPRFPVTAQNPRTANLRAHDEPERPSPRPSQRIPGNQYAEPLPAHEAYADEEVRAPRRAEAPIPRSRRAEPQRAEGYAPESAPRHARGRPQTAPYQDDYRRGQERDEYDPQYDDDAYLADEAEDLY